MPVASGYTIFPSLLSLESGHTKYLFCCVFHPTCVGVLRMCMCILTLHGMCPELFVTGMEPPVGRRKWELWESFGWAATASRAHGGGGPVLCWKLLGKAGMVASKSVMGFPGVKEAEVWSGRERVRVRIGVTI